MQDDESKTLENFKRIIIEIVEDYFQLTNIDCRLTTVQNFLDTEDFMLLDVCVHFCNESLFLGKLFYCNNEIRLLLK